jgi:uncharacterized protein (TIGR02118 family)
MAQMIVIYKTPNHTAAFDRHYFDVQVPLARRLPGLRKCETSRGPIISLYGTGEAHFVATLHFDSLSDVNATFTSEWARACAADGRQLAARPSDVQMYLFETQSV